MDALQKTSLRFDQLAVSSAADADALFNELRAQAETEAAQIHNAEALESYRVKWLRRRDGISSRITENWLKPAPPDAKKWIGAGLNQLRAALESAVASAKDSESNLESGPAIDLSLPGDERPIGTRHLIRQTLEELERIFAAIGFSMVSGPEIETPYYNFEALNIPEHHPARDNMDTFYIDGTDHYLLRTHTSPMQVRTMEKQPPPVRIVVPGKVYRRDNPDATHGFMFHQIEGLAVDTDITFCDFRGTVEYFVREFLGPHIKTRLRPSYFPFTEPSVEVDATCVFCGGKGCNVCKQSGWIELFGAGMVDPAVYRFVNYDAMRLSGFAVSLGVERPTQLKYNINDLQLYYQNDVRFLRQFA